jgi:glycosyltransferase involved in cell wall biosynthesis
LARHAKHVVVPEYNRACIQQVWWQLPMKPIVLPNKPQWDNLSLREEDYPDVLSVFNNESRKILLYQGIFYSDRNFDPYIKATEMLGDEYVLFLMGKAWSKGEKAELERLKKNYKGFKYAGFVNPPGHLAFTRYGHIGLLPYQAPAKKARYLKSSYLASINALYCAPNKIWEYAREGMPMLGSDVPGLRVPFEQFDMGMVSGANPEDIAEKISLIDARHDEMGGNARRFYESVDIDRIIASILE